MKENPSPGSETPSDLSGVIILRRRETSSMLAGQEMKEEEEYAVAA